MTKETPKKPTAPLPANSASKTSEMPQTKGQKIVEIPLDDKVIAESADVEICPPCPICFKGRQGVGIPYGRLEESGGDAPLAFKCNKCACTFTLGKDHRRIVVKNYRMCAATPGCDGIAKWTHKEASGLCRFKCWKCGKKFKRIIT